MSAKSKNSSQADGDGQHHHCFAPTVHFDSCRDAKIYVNTIINRPHPHSSSPPSENASKPSPGDEKPPYYIDPLEGGRVDIYCGSKEDANLPMISVEIQQPPSEGTAENKPMTYVITVHKNNVSWKEIVAAFSEDKRVAFDHIIRADNVILNSSEAIPSVRLGAGGTNTGNGSAKCHRI